MSFLGDRRLGYAANLWLRSAVRVQDCCARRRAATRSTPPSARSSGSGTATRPDARGRRVGARLGDDPQGFAGFTVKDAIVDRFRARTGTRPSVDADDPDLPVKLVLKNDALTIWRNLSGESLHKRGWRPIQVKSPLNEAIAAGLLMLSGWDRKSPLVDPMCGSGTFVVEAALLAADRAPGLRRFAFERWPDFDAALWRS